MSSTPILALTLSGFWTANKDFFALLLSLVALVVSIVTGWRSISATRTIARDSAESNIKLNQSATYQRIHEMLIDPKAAAGRRLLFEAAKNSQFPSLGEAGWDDINYSLALYDTLGAYIARQQVDEDLILAAWHHPLTDIAVPVRMFMTHRQNQQIYQPWAFLMTMLASAEKYPCHCPSFAGGIANDSFSLPKDSGDVSADQ